MEIEQEKHSNKTEDKKKNSRTTRRMIEALIRRKEELESHPELLSVREQEELDITPQRIEFLVSNSLGASVEDASSNKNSKETEMGRRVGNALNESAICPLPNLEHFKNTEAFVSDQTTSCSMSNVEKDQCNFYHQNPRQVEDPCRTFAEFLIKLGEEGIRNLRPSTILDLAQTYYSESVRLERIALPM